MIREPFASAFSTPDERCRSMADAVEPLLPTLPELSFMDIGSGMGGIAFSLAGLEPQATILGVDINEDNVRIATDTADALGLEQRVHFILADYRARSFPLVGLIVSFSTLQNIPGDPRDLFAKLEQELLPGGYLVCTVPDGSLFNHLLWTARRVFRAIRCAATDKAIFWVAKLLSRGRFSDEFLRERVSYMYLLPYSYDCAGFRKMLADVGLHLRDIRKEPHASLGQPTHNLLLLQKKG